MVCPGVDSPSLGDRSCAKGFGGQALTHFQHTPCQSPGPPPSSHPRMCEPLLQAYAQPCLPWASSPLSPVSPECALLCHGGGWAFLSTLLDARALRTRTVTIEVHLFHKRLLNTCKWQRYSSHSCAAVRPARPLPTNGDSSEHRRLLDVAAVRQSRDWAEQGSPEQGGQQRCGTLGTGLSPGGGWQAPPAPTPPSSAPPRPASDPCGGCPGGWEHPRGDKPSSFLPNLPQTSSSN